MGSVGFLLIFAAVNGANAKLAGETGSRRWLPLVGVALCIGALISLLWETADRAPYRLLIPVVMIGASFIIEAVFRVATGRTIRLSKSSKQ